MNEQIFKHLEFAGQAFKISELPSFRSARGHPVGEIALAGASNVGKSSLINAISGKKGLAKVAKLPGKTRAITFFRALDSFVLADLPGWGYAAVAKSVQEEWGHLIEKYLKKRESLTLIFLLVDIRRPLSSFDLAFIEWAAHFQKKIVLVLSKCDKVAPQIKEKNKNIILSLLSNKALPFVYFSSKTCEGIVPIRSILRKYHVS
jgi:GTP-binding protein